MTTMWERIGKEERRQLVDMSYGSAPARALARAHKEAWTDAIFDAWCQLMDIGLDSDTCELLVFRYGVVAMADYTPPHIASVRANGILYRAWRTIDGLEREVYNYHGAYWGIWHDPVLNEWNMDMTPF